MLWIITYHQSLILLFMFCFLFIRSLLLFFFFFFFNDTATTEIYTLSLHDALPIYTIYRSLLRCFGRERYLLGHEMRSEEHTSELQSHSDLVCRLLLEKKKKKIKTRDVKMNKRENNQKIQTKTTQQINKIKLTSTQH